ncbi:RipA family octameric membrane protein [Lampropedia hyalina]|nr:hypothetical protein [Lampropedia hyalina]
MCESENTEKISAIRKFDIALRMRDFEITQLAQRNNFFMIFQGVLFAGLVQSSHTKPIVSFMVCMVGFLVSIFQVGMASGAKFWQEYWEQKLSDYEALASSAESAELFHDDVNKYKKTVEDRMDKRGVCGLLKDLIMYRFSVSRIPIYVGIALSMIWGLLVICALRGYPPFSIPSFIVGF